MNLPVSEGLSVSALSRLFSKRTNSYKFLFFMALLEALEDRKFETSDPFDLNELSTRMVALAWYPVVKFKISLGKQDQVSNAVEGLNSDFIGSNFSFDKEGKKNLIVALKEQGSFDSLVRYVPFRLIRPFFGTEMSNTPDHQVNKKLIKLSNDHFETLKPLYRFGDNTGNKIYVQPEWGNYFKVNLVIVQSWVSWEWLQYVQDRNPHTPALASKLFPPTERISLIPERKLWLNVLKESGELSCIYSKAKLTEDDLSIDHFIPWSYIGHNKFWNLVPTSQSINSSKGDRIPSDRYFESFVESQAKAISILKNSISNTSWENLAYDYYSGLNLKTQVDLLSHEKLRTAFQYTLDPIIKMAKNQGFQDEWILSI